MVDWQKSGRVLEDQLDSELNLKSGGLCRYENKFVGREVLLVNSVVLNRNMVGFNLWGYVFIYLYNEKLVIIIVGLHYAIS